MGRLIDADRLYNTIIDEIDPISISMDGGEMRGMMRTIIAAEPTIEAVPVVRCTACKHWDQDSGLTARMCYQWRRYTKQFDYCSYGEARTCG